MIGRALQIFPKSIDDITDVLYNCECQWCIFNVFLTSVLPQVYSTSSCLDSDLGKQRKSSVEASCNKEDHFYCKIYEPFNATSISFCVGKPDNPSVETDGYKSDLKAEQKELSPLPAHSLLGRTNDGYATTDALDGYATTDII